MSDGEYPKIRGATAAEACVGRKLSAEAKGLLAEGQTPIAYIGILESEGFFVDAETILAHALPKREAVWWACRGVRKALGAKSDDDPVDPPAAEAALKAAASWAAAPGESNRRKAYGAAEAAGFGHPAGCAALAAYFSGGSLAPPDLPAVPPADHLTGDCVASALMLASVMIDPARSSDHHIAFLEIGRAVARGQDRWKDNL